MLAMFSIEIDHSKTISFRNEPLFHFCSSISNKMANNDEFIQFSPQIPLVTVIQLGYFCLRIKRKKRKLSELGVVSKVGSISAYLWFHRTV